MASETRYLVINTIPDPENMEGFQLYLSKIIPIFQSCGGKPVGRWKTEEQILGDGGIKASAVFEFPSAQVIRDMVNGTEFRALDQLRSEAYKKVDLMICDAL